MEKNRFCREEFSSIKRSLNNRNSDGKSQKSEVRIQDILLEPDDSDSSLCATTSPILEDQGEISSKGGDVHRKKDPLSPMPSSFSSSSSKLCMKWALPQWLVLGKKKASASGRGKECDGKRLGYRAPSWKGIGHKEGKDKKRACDPPPESLVPQELEETHLASEEAGTAMDENLKRSSLQEEGNNCEESSFNLGVGVGLIFLFAKTANEFNKMERLRKEIETLLKETKESMQKEDAILNPPDSMNNLSLTCSGSSADQPSHYGLTSQFPLECDDRQNCVAEIVNDDGCQAMDRLQAELQSEIEQMELDLETEDFMITIMNGVEVCRDNRDISVGENMMFEEETGMDDGEDSEQYSEYQYGVSPHDLERRLHELLETRQQERIAELESALRRIERKLQEKEMEIHRWRNAAQLAHMESRRSC